MSTATQVEMRPIAPGRLSLTRGGPFFRLERRLHLEGSDAWPRLIGYAMIFAWGPFVALGLLEGIGAGESNPLLRSVGAHTRLLVSLPLLLVAEEVAERRIKRITGRLLPEGMLDAPSADVWRRTVARVEHWRDAWLPEVLLLIAVYTLITLAVLGLLSDELLRWLAPGLRESREVFTSPSGWWFYFVALPLLLFLALRFLWRLLLWSEVLLRLSTLRLHLQASHPDRAGGIGFLIAPLDADRLFILAVGSSLAATWLDEILRTGVKAASFASYFLAYLVLAVVVVTGPYLPLSPLLVRTRLKGAKAYSQLARRYIDRFEARWIRREEEDPLGSPDFQSLADLGQGYDVVASMRATIFSARDLVVIFVTALLPILPVVLAGVPADEIARRLFERFL